MTESQVSPAVSFRTSESVTEGHPDKVADQISDAVLDACLRHDPRARVACETLIKSNLVVLAGEVTSTYAPDWVAIVRQTLATIGYDGSAAGFDGQSCAVLTAINRQSTDIARGVGAATDAQGAATAGVAAATDARGASGAGLDAQGAGDQGVMYGYACRDTPELMPAPIVLAHKLARRLAAVRKEGVLPFLRPDGKTQVTYVYENGRPVRIATIVVSSQHDAAVDQPTLRDAIVAEVIVPCLPAAHRGDAIDYKINPAGPFVIGGPAADAGVTGRKIIVDTYGGVGRHGGGAFSGKDPSKVDRSAAYFARYVAKNVVAAGLADRCEVQIAYAIGEAQPVSIAIDTFGSAHCPEAVLTRAVKQVFDARPAAIVQRLQLLRPIYGKIAAYGHFGREGEGMRWEQTDAAEQLAAFCRRPV